MNNLTRFENDGIEIFIDSQGKSFASISGVARMTGKHLRTVQNFIERTAIPVIKAEVETSNGKKLHVMLSSSSICKVLAQYNTERLVQFAEVGVETALHQIAGYQQQATPQNPQQQIEDLTTTQLNAIVFFGELLKGSKTKFNPADFLLGIDHAFWHMPIDAAEYALKLQQLLTIRYQSKLTKALIDNTCSISEGAMRSLQYREFTKKCEQEVADPKLALPYQQFVASLAPQLTRGEVGLIELKPLGFSKSKK